VESALRGVPSRARRRHVRDALVKPTAGAGGVTRTTKKQDHRARLSFRRRAADKSG